MSEGVFECVVEHTDTDFEKRLNGMSVPGHLLAFGHSLRYDLIDGGFCKTCGDSGPLTVSASIVRHRIRVQFQVADGLQQSGPELSNSILLFKTTAPHPSGKVY
jgi:hypothetical protein